MTQEKFEMQHFENYLRDNYGKEVVDSFIMAMCIGVSDTAHYEAFIETLVEARMKKNKEKAIEI